MKKLIPLITLSLVLASCASSEIKQLDTEMDVKGTTSQGLVGVKDNKAIIQEKHLADDELRIQQWKNFQLENDLNHEYHMTQWCYNDLSDPRLGGNGEVTEAPDLQKLKNVTSVKQELGLEGENLVVVKTSSFAEKLAAEQQYEKSLQEMLGEVKKTRASCERKMTAARVKAGLPGKRTDGRYTINPDGKVNTVIQAPERSLDDAFATKKATEPQVRKPAESVKKEEPTSEPETPASEEASPEEVETSQQGQ